MYNVVIYIFMLLANIGAIPRYSYDKWQQSVYGIVNTINAPTYSQTTLFIDAEEKLHFTTYAAFLDPHDKYKTIIKDQANVPNWALIMRVDNKRKNEMAHRGSHDGIPCNAFYDNRFLFHILTSNFPQLEVIFRVWNVIIETNLGVISYLEIDKSFDPPGIDRVSDLKIVIWAFPHPKIKGLVVVISQGYVTSIFPLSNSKIQDSIRWHINSIMENFGEKLM